MAPHSFALLLALSAALPACKARSFGNAGESAAQDLQIVGREAGAAQGAGGLEVTIYSGTPDPNGEKIVFRGLPNQPGAFFRVSARGESTPLQPRITFKGQAFSGAVPFSLVPPENQGLSMRRQEQYVILALAPAPDAAGSPFKHLRGQNYISQAPLQEAFKLCHEDDTCDVKIDWSASPVSLSIDFKNVDYLSSKSKTPSPHANSLEGIVIWSDLGMEFNCFSYPPQLMSVLPLMVKPLGADGAAAKARLKPGLVRSINGTELSVNNWEQEVPGSLGWNKVLEALDEGGERGLRLGIAPTTNDAFLRAARAPIEDFHIRP